MAKQLNRLLYIILIIAVVVSFAIIIFDLAPKNYWWLVLLTINYAAVISCIYFIKSFGIQVGFFLTIIIFIIGYFFCTIGKLLPYVDNTPTWFSQYYYVTIGCLWVVSIAISKAFTQHMPLSIRTVVTFLLILFIEYCMMPVMALFSHYIKGNQDFLYYSIKLSGYLIIVGFTIIFYFLLLFFETIKLTRKDILWRSRMYPVFWSLVSLPIFIGFKDGHWHSSILIIIISSSVIVVAMSKERSD